MDVQFIEQFIGGPTNHGVSVDRATGSVKVESTSPLTNFVIHATVKDTNVTPNKTFEIAIRVQIHDSVTDSWLTPSPLTVRRNTSGVRFSILARFNDDVIGAIPSNSNVLWTSDTPGIDVNGSTGEISAGGTASSAQITAQISVTPILALIRSSELKVVDAWSTPTKASWVSGNKSKAPENIGLSENLNILFIPDGFTQAQKPLFDKMVLEFVKGLQTNEYLEPFNVLSDSINYWSAFIPSREAGTTALYDMNVKILSGTLYGDDIPFAEKSPSTTGALTLAQLIYKVGMPIPADKNIDFGTKLSQWSLIYGIDASRVNQPRYKEWQDLREHRIANEKDTALGIRLGDRPNVSNFLLDSRTPSFHPFRTNRQQLDQFLSNITFKGTNIGTTWTTRKEGNFVVVLLAGSRHAGVRRRDEIMLSLRDEALVKIKEVTGRVDIQSYPIPTHISPRSLARVAHETAHMLGCGDEYGELVQLPDDEIPELGRYGNVQDGKSLLGAAGIDGNKIKWLWHRITKAGVLKLPPLKISDELYKISLNPKHSRIFGAEDKIGLLRRRPLLKFPDTSDELLIVNVNKDNDVVDVTVSTGADLSSFGAGSILFIPIKNPLGTGSNELLLVAPNIIEHINTTHGPLNADFPPPRGNPSRACNANVIDVDLRQKAKNLPNNLPSYPMYREWIVGLYEGGDEYYCGVYHPSGVCIMRSTKPYLLKGRPGIYSFCHVCKYILVDRLDPTKHGEIDELDYGKKKGYKNKYPFRL